MKKIVLLFILTTFSMFSQTINDYQYVIVPAKYDFLKSDDRFNLNTTTKFLLEKYGFIVYMNNQELPNEIANNRCTSLTANLVNENTMLQTKVKLVLKDCQDKVVFETELGTSRAKDYAKAYNEAFRDAAKSFETLNYKYNGSNKTVLAKKPTVTAQTNVTSEVFKSSETAVPLNRNPTNTMANGHFYAQPIENGFQLVNTEPKVIYTLYNTSIPDFFIATKGEQQGVFFKKADNWYFEYYQSNTLYSENVGVKF
ncbi:hypothetical protein [Flavobacterium sp.]